jgi:hypothetical protein
MKTTTRKTKTTKPVADLGGYRTVVLTNGTQYVTSYNVCFGIIYLGEKKDAARMYLKDAPEILRDLNKYGVHKLYAEVV